MTRLLLIAALALPGCEDPNAPVARDEVDAVVREHAGPLSRMSCAGCPPEWEPPPCDFIKHLRQDGTGTTPARCQAVATPLSMRDLPSGVTSIAIERVADGVLAARKTPEAAIELYAFGGDLKRLGRGDLWVLGQEAQTHALDALADHKPKGTWPADLVRLNQYGVPPTRIADAIMVESLSRPTPITVAEFAQVKEASAVASRALKTTGDERIAALAHFEQLVGAAVDIAKVFTTDHALLERSHEIAVNAAIRQAQTRSRCVSSLEELVPDHLPVVPPGWELQAERCVAEKTTRPVPRDGIAGAN